MTPTPTATVTSPIGFLELEITRKCALACGHCYAEASPYGGEGTMGAADWRTVITDAAHLGVTDIQLIGGEPTMAPFFGDLVELAVTAGLKLEVFSHLNLPRPPWGIFSLPGVSLATSYYSDTESGRPGMTR